MDNFSGYRKRKIGSRFLTHATLEIPIMPSLHFIRKSAEGALPQGERGLMRIEMRHDSKACHCIPRLIRGERMGLCSVWLVLIHKDDVDDCLTRGFSLY